MTYIKKGYKKNMPMNICYKGDKNTLSDVFGDEPIDACTQVKIIWDYIRTGIAKRGKI